MNNTMERRMLCRRIWFWQRDEFKAAGWIIGHHTLWRKIRPVAVKPLRTALSNRGEHHD